MKKLRLVAGSKQSSEKKLKNGWKRSAGGEWITILKGW
jgi:hypothetical protein